jgi:hypothetical protein
MEFDFEDIKIVSQEKFLQNVMDPAQHQLQQ